MALACQGEGLSLQAPTFSERSGEAEAELVSAEQKGATQTVSERESAGKSASLGRGYGWLLSGNLAHAISGWGMLALLARLGSPEVVGQFALALAFAAPALMLTGLQLRAILATDASSRFRFGDYLSLRGLGSGLALLLVLLSTWLLAYPRELLLIIGALTLARAVESLSDVSHGLFQRHERLDWLGRSLLLRAPLSLAAVAGGFLLSSHLLGAALALSFAALGLFLFHDLRLAARLVGGRSRLVRRSSKGLQRLTLTGLPLGSAALLTTLCASLPRWVLERSEGTFELGIFAALSYFLVAQTLLITTLGQSAAARLASLWAKGERRAWRSLLLRLCSLAVAAGIAGLVVSLLAGSWLLGLLYGSEYLPYSEVLNQLMAAGLFACPAVICGFALTSIGQFRVQVPQMASAALATLVTSLVLIPSQGISGAVWAVSAGFATQLIFGLLVLKVAVGRAEH